jgi:hypothetical protein
MSTEELADLDDSWISEFEKSDNEYKLFYKENIQSIKVRCMYINKDNVLEKIKEENIFLKKPNILSKEEIIIIVKNNNKINKTQYSLLTLLKYNIDLEPINLKTFLKTNSFSTNYLTCIKNIDNIHFSPSIYMFQDLNDIFILFYETNNIYNVNISNKNGTKKIFIKPVNGAKNKTYKKSA